MNEKLILQPMFALVLWTGVVLLLIPFVRARSVKRHEIVVDDFKYGESSSVPDRVCVPNRNYMNLLEAPLLFHLACVVIFITHAITPSMVKVAWAYVALRVLHSLIHLTYNKVVHRLLVFGASNVVLTMLWVMAWYRAA
jgi:hypothetical protein